MTKPSLIDRLSKLPTYLHLSDIQGLSQLITQGVLGVTGLAENVQGNVYKAIAARLGPLGARFIDVSPGRSGIKPGGITGRVYGTVKGVARLAGGTVNAALGKAAPLLSQRFGTPASSPEREALLAVINGVLGDQLLATANPLTISMSMRHHGRPLPLEAAALAQALPHATGKLLVVLHGLCMNDLQWTTAQSKSSVAHNHAEVLGKSLGYTPVYLHYNTGLHTSINGQQLAQMLEQLLSVWPRPVEELCLLAHSMGGLVSRSACHSAELGGMRWRKKLKSIVFLGTPHHGAPLEQVGSWVDTLLGSNRFTQPFAAIGQIRSCGITDLRYGHVLASSWQGKKRFERSPDSRQPLPLPVDVDCYAVAATSFGQTGVLKDALAGDGLVSVRSALGQHDDPQLGLDFAASHTRVFRGVNHMQLLSCVAISDQLVEWLSQDTSAHQSVKSKCQTGT